MRGTAYISLKKYLQSVDWTALFFLILILNVKLVIKIAVLLIISFINRKELFQKKIFNEKFILFYFSMILLVVVNILVNRSLISSPSYLITSSISICFWLMSAVVAYNFYLLVEAGDIRKLHNALTLFFILNLVFILFNFLLIQIETGAVNPYEYKGLNQKYYISTGDYIRGISFDNCVTTATISAFGIFYFLYRRNFFLSIISMSCFLLLASNLTNFAFVCVLIFVFLFQSDKIQKSIIVIYIMLLTVFMVKISPHNLEYVQSWVYKQIGKAYYLPKKDETFATLKKTPDSLLSFDERRKKSALISIDSLATTMVKKSSSPIKTEQIKVPVPVVRSKKDSLFYVYKEPVVSVEKTNKYTSFIDSVYTPLEVADIRSKIPDWTKPGKWIGSYLLYEFLKEHPAKILTGNGAANFSSRLAFKATALDIAGRYPKKLRYINPDFKNNQLYVYLYYHSQGHSKQAALNIPDSVYEQLLGEYGIIGFLSFIILYAGYFLKRAGQLTFGIPLLLLLAASFFFEYWFELLSVVILFEFMVLVNIKESANTNSRG